MGGLHIGSGSGQLVAGVAGVVAGAVAGSALEQAIRVSGVEYTVVLQNGESLTVAQNVSERYYTKVNDRVIVRKWSISGCYQRTIFLL